MSREECYLNQMPQDIINKIGEYHPQEKDSFALRWAVQNWPGLHDLFQFTIGMDILPEDTIKNIAKLTKFDISEFAYTPISVTDCILLRRLDLPITIQEGIDNALSATEKFAEIYGYTILNIQHFKPHTATVGYNVLTHNINITMIKTPTIFPIKQKLNVLSKATSETYQQSYNINYQELDHNQIDIQFNNLLII